MSNFPARRAPFRAVSALLLIACVVSFTSESLLAQGRSRTQSSPTSTVTDGDFFEHGKPDPLFTQESEVGSPHRLGLTVEFGFEDFDDDSESQMEGCALADWSKVSLSPPLFLEYKFATGRILHGEGMEEEEEEPPEFAALRRMTSRVRRPQEEPGAEEPHTGEPDLPDVAEGRQFLPDFGEHVAWAPNLFFEQETSGDRGREWGFARSIGIPLPTTKGSKPGVEMQSPNFTDKDTGGDAEHSFVIGPTIAWKPNRRSRLDVSPLFGVTEAAPRVQVFAVSSILFGGGSTSHEAEAPASTRNC